MSFDEIQYGLQSSLHCIVHLWVGDISSDSETMLHSGHVHHHKVFTKILTQNIVDCSAWSVCVRIILTGKQQDRLPYTRY